MRNRFCLPYFFGYVALILLFYSQAAWLPTMVIRRFGLSASISGGVGPFALGWIVERLADPQNGLST